MKQIFYLIFLSVTLFAVSCNKQETRSNGDVQDIVWNQKVQDSFYGFRLGESVDIDSLLYKLYQQGFSVDTIYSTEDRLIFNSSYGQYFTFGGFTWWSMTVGLDNGCLTSISFLASHKDKAVALEHYNNIKDELETKYAPTITLPKDTTVYAITNYFGVNDVAAQVICSRYESVDNEIFIGDELIYYTTNNSNSSNSEL